MSIDSRSQLDSEDLRQQFESMATDPTYKFRRSRRGTYVNPAVSRDWKWFQSGAVQRDLALTRPASDITTQIIRGVCETDPADPDLKDTLCISVADLKAIVDRALTDVALTRPAVPERSSEHYDEVRATLTGLRTLCQNISNIELRVGPLGSHARGYTHKINAALRHLERLAAAPQPGSLQVQLTDDTMRAIRTRALDEFGTGQAQGELWDQILMRETARTIQAAAKGGA